MTTYSPNELWEGIDEMLYSAFLRTVREREYRNERFKKIFPTEFSMGQLVLVPNEKATEKLDPKWEGPYKLTEKLSGTRWRAIKIGRKPKRGRRPIGVFHEDQLQPFDL